MALGMRYTSTVEGSVTRQVTCEKCSAEYEYKMTRSAMGSSMSILFLNNNGAAANAQDEAEESLKKQLKTSYVQN